MAKGTIHGYEMLGQLREMGVELNPGTLYRTLRASEAQGLVVSFWDLGGGPPRRLYRLTKQGWVYLQSLRKVLEGQRNTLDDFIKRLDNLGERG